MSIYRGKNVPCTVMEWERTFCSRPHSGDEADYELLQIDLLSRARGLLNPIQWEEPFGMVMIEAMAVGCPVIAFARGAAPEIVAHRRSGFLVQNVNEMVHCISVIDELDRMAVRAHVEQHFTAYMMAEKYTRVYEMIIASSVGNVTSGRCSSNDVPALIAPLFPSVTPLSSTHVKTDESAPLPFQVRRIAKRTVEVG